MSDDQTLAATPDVTSNAAEGETPEANTETTATTEAEAKPEGQEQTEPEGEEKPKRIPGSRREKFKNEHLQRENQELYRRLEEAERRLPKADGGADQEKPPQEADFNGDYLAYERALTAYNVEQAVQKALSVRDQSRRQTEQREIVRELAAAHQERVEEARESIPDFDQVLASARGISVAPQVEQELLSSDKSALLAYYLAKNPDKLLALNGMSGRELAREMGRLEGSVRMPSSKKQTTAPTPLTPLRGGASPSFDPSKASMDEYMAKRSSGWSG